MINIYTFCFNRPDFLELQYKAFKKHLKEEHRLICVNNANDSKDRAAIYYAAEELGIETFTPIGVDHSLAGRSHQQALNKVWERAKKDNETIIIVDHDMMPIKEFNLYKDFDIAGVIQGRGERIKYFHPGIMIIHPSLKDRDQVDFTGEEIDGHRCDTGGEWHKYLQSHPDLKIKELNLVDIPDEEFGDDKLQICDDFLLHFRNASGWLNTPKEIVEMKRQKLVKMLNL